MAKTMMTVDGNTAAAHVAYAMSDVAAIYPITPPRPSARSATNGQPRAQEYFRSDQVLIRQLQSEAGAAAAVHGSLAAGALTSSYTASQGLLLMIPNMYKMSGELPARRAACHRPRHCRPRPLDFRRPSGRHGRSPDRFCAAGIQLGPGGPGYGPGGPSCGHRRQPALSALFRRLPHQPRDPENRSHRLRRHGQTGQPEALAAFRARGTNPERPELRGTAQNPDIYYQGREAANAFT
jgi:pyruvate-ferredoxin/flavodoxin oxidoreductase